MDEDDLSALGVMACGRRNCCNQAEFRPVVLVFLLNGVQGLQSPIGLRPHVRQCYVCARHRRDVYLEDVFPRVAMECVVSMARAMGTTLTIDRNQTRLAWDEI